MLIKRIPGRCHFGIRVPSHESHDITKLRLLDCFLRYDLTNHKNPVFIALCDGYSPVTDIIPSQRASDEENVSMALRLHFTHEPLARYVILLVAHAPGMLGTFSTPSRVSDSDMHHGTYVTHVP